jgi:hypothetical protein
MSFISTHMTFFSCVLVFSCVCVRMCTHLFSILVFVLVEILHSLKLLERT